MVVIFTKQYCVNEHIVERQGTFAEQNIFDMSEESSE